MTFLWIGTALGALVGLLHGAAMFGARRAAGGALGEALYYSVWTLALWTLFGAYVLLFYILGGVAMLVARLFRKGAPA